ncbi:cobalamin binding intrinsic factor [Rhinophrynus dorsalis]
MLKYLLYAAFILSVPYTGAQKETVNIISVQYTVINDLIGDSFKHSIQVSVQAGSTLLQVMEKAAEINPKVFSFSIEETSLGPFVSTINHLSGNSNGKTYWQFFSGTTPLDEGVGTYIPQDKEHILAIFSKY